VFGPWLALGLSLGRQNGQAPAVTRLGRSGAEHRRSAVDGRSKPGCYDGEIR